ncbi:MAG: tagatose 1,6-diphosphate aldolase [Aggregatilineales bacterium]
MALHALTPGKYRHLRQCGPVYLNILAIDHRGNLRSSLEKASGHTLTDPEFAAFKAQLISHLLPSATAILTDPDFGFSAVFADNHVTPGLIAPLEVTNYDLHPSQRRPDLIPDWSVAKIKRFGGAGVKLLLYYHPHMPNAAAQRDFVKQIVEYCAEQDIPFFLEPIACAPDESKTMSNDERRDVIIQNAELFSTMGIDVLKTEFPIDAAKTPDEMAWKTALRDLDSACRVPWALLSAGTDYSTFKRQVELACQAGASGVMVGRAVWAEAVTTDGAARDQFLRETARQRMDELAAICAAHARPWPDQVAAPNLSPGWYQR